MAKIPFMLFRGPILSWLICDGCGVREGIAWGGNETQRNAFMVDSKQPLIIITYLSYYHYCNGYYLKRLIC